MKTNFIALLSLLLFTFSCQKENKTDEIIEVTEVQEMLNVDDYESFGEFISTDGLITPEQMLEKYNSLAIGDSVSVTFRSTVNSVCQQKGCWMKLDLADENAQSFVRFKDYEFFVPKDAAGADAIVKGVAFKSETSAEELRHYAKDAGKSEEEIAAITEPKIDLNFMAEGVLLKSTLNEGTENQ